MNSTTKPDQTASDMNIGQVEQEAMPPVTVSMKKLTAGVTTMFAGIVQMLEALEPQMAQRLADIAANIVPQVVATFETTVSPAATKCDKKYADLQAAVAAGKTIVAKIKDKAPVLYLASDGGANGPMTFQGDVWGGTFSASTGPGTHTYYLCTLTKADVATIETNEA